MAIRTAILGTGHYVPERVVTNKELETMMDTTDEWIQQRTGIKERRWIDKEMGASELGKIATDRALEMAGLKAKDLDAIIFATLSPDYNFPGSGCLLQAQLGIPGTAALDIRNQCTGFVYGTQIADAWIKSGMYKRVLLVGAEVHSTGLDLTTSGRDVSVIFGDGAGAVIFGAVDSDTPVGVLGTSVGADGNFAKSLWVELPASRMIPRLPQSAIDEGRHYPKMNGRDVFKYAVRKLPETVHATLAASGVKLEEVDLFIPHQANLRISEAVQQALGLPESKMFNNIDRLGNTTAGSIPIAIDECVRNGRLQRGQLLLTAAFGAGFTWGGAVFRF